MHIFKFGGISIKDASSIKRVSEIISSTPSKVVVVISAMGKTTKMLTKIVKIAHQGGDYNQLFIELKEGYHEVIKELLEEIPERYKSFEKELEKKLKQVQHNEWLLAYDKIVSYGELMSTAIVESYLNESEWFDIRSILCTDSHFSAANILWEETEKRVIRYLKPLVEKKVVVTQGFIGQDLDGNSTTLGLEGSDFTGAILAYCLQATKYTVWKDVPGILNADPRLLDKTEQYEKINYREVAEMTYYGSQVIHPKTLKPIAKKNIPLVVRSFLDKKGTGTLISSEKTTKIIPYFVFKKNQFLVTAQVKDHDFMDKTKIGLILHVIEVLNIKINFMQNSAFTFSFCIDYEETKLLKIKELLAQDFILLYNEELTLATIKNYTSACFDKLPKNRFILMEQKTRSNYQELYHEIKE